ncbi:unnamed protein product [Cuscuta epithymum]|uniref:Glycosyltransferases n=1 Tax=Cuscuta epithymum TaxID=186058 RepID=A0AAV0CLH5_9ASTE|nr:unnamed protein product [Cuscuta epithymum]
MERSKKKVQVWKKAVGHILLCFVMGFFTGFAPSTGNSSMFSGRHFLPKPQTNYTLETPHDSDKSDNLIKKTLMDSSNFSAAKPKHTMKLQEKGTPQRLVIIVTPTAMKHKIGVGVLLRRLANTLKLVPRPLLWVVVGQQQSSSEVSMILRMTGIMCRHLVVKENFTDFYQELDHQRNVALSHIEHHRLSGIIHFAGLLNVYDLNFFHHLRTIEDFGTWPVALLGSNKSEVVIEGPVCDSSSGVIGWHLKKVNNQTDENPPIRVSNFAFNSSILWDSQRWGRASSLQDTSQDSLKFVRKELIEDEANVMGIPQEDCSRVLLWNFRVSK